VHVRKRVRSRSLSQDQASPSHRIRVIAVYIVQIKLDPGIISDVFRIVDSDQVFTDPSNSHQGVRYHLCHDVSEADVVVTAVRMRRRLERHIDWDIAVRSSSLSLCYRRLIGYHSESKGDRHPAVASGFGSGWQTIALR
jgi:hypothetical protein